LLGGCGQGLQSGEKPPAPTSNTPAPAPNGAVARTDADYMATALQLPMLGEISWATEPKGEVTGVYRPQLLYVHISDVTTSPASITFDAWQVFTGPAASEEASRDHQPIPKNGYYERNQYAFEQSMTVAPSAGAMLQFPLEGQTAYGDARYSKLTVATFDEFAVRRKTGKASHWLPWAGYWITVNDKGVQSIVQQYKQ
jgi:hypothetical protein